MARRKTRDAEATKQQIIKAAETLFAQKGFAGTTLREIAEASGISGPLIVFHFNDKQGVYDAVKAAIIQRRIENHTASAPAGDSFDAFIEHVLHSMFQFYRDNPTMMRLANWGRLEGESDPWPGEDEYHHIYIDRIEAAQACGEIRSDLTPLNISIMICGAIHIWWEYHEHFLKHVIGEKGKDATAADDFYFQQCLSFVRRGLSNPAEAPEMNSPPPSPRTQ